MACYTPMKHTLLYKCGNFNTEKVLVSDVSLEDRVLTVTKSDGSVKTYDIKHVNILNATGKKLLSTVLVG